MVNILFKLPQLPFHGEESHKNLMFGIVLANKNRSLTTEVLRKEGSVCNPGGLVPGEGSEHHKWVCIIAYFLLIYSSRRNGTILLQHFY